MFSHQYCSTFKSSGMCHCVCGSRCCKGTIILQNVTSYVPCKCHISKRHETSNYTKLTHDSHVVNASVQKFQLHHHSTYSDTIKFWCSTLKQSRNSNLSLHDTQIQFHQPFKKITLFSKILLSDTFLHIPMYVINISRIFIYLGKKEIYCIFLHILHHLCSVFHKVSFIS